MTNFATVAWHMTDSLLFRWLLLLGLICGAMTLAARFLTFVSTRNNEGDRIAADALGFALNETDETWDQATLLSRSRAAQRIRAQIEANHEAEVARFRDELNNYGGAS